MHFPLTLLHSIPLATFRALFRAYGCSLRVASRDDVARLLDAPPPSLLWPRRMLTSLGTTAGRAALVEAASAAGEDTSTWSAHETPAVLVATLLTRVPTDPETRRLFDAAGYRLCRREPDAPRRRYVAESASMREVSPAALAQMAERIARANARRLATGDVEVRLRAYESGPDGACDVRLDAFVPRPHEPLVTRSATGELEVTVTAPYDVDQLHITRSPTGRVVLWIATRSPELLRAYRAAVGAALFGNANLLLKARPISLLGLARIGREGLEKVARANARVRGARVVRALWDPGHEETLTAAGRDVLRALEREELPIHGSLISTTIRLDTPTGPVDVLLRAPNVVHWEPCEEDDAVRAFVDALGIDEPREENFLALAPFNLTEARWKRAIGAELFADLLARKRLVRTTSRALADQKHPEAGRILLAFTLSAGRYYAVPEEGFDVASRIVKDDDLVTYKLDLPLFGADLARGLGLTGEVKLIERGMLLDIGERRLGATPVHLYLQVGVRSSEGLGDRLRKASMPAHPVLLVPPGQAAQSGCATVPFTAMGGPYETILGAVAKALSISDGRDFWSRVPEGTRVAIEMASGHVWIDGVEMVEMADPSCKLYLVLAEAAGRPVSLAACGKRISSAANSAKNAKLRAQKAIRSSFARASVPLPNDVGTFIETSRAGYRLTVPCWIG